MRKMAPIKILRVEAVAAACFKLGCGGLLPEEEPADAAALVDGDMLTSLL